VRKSVWEQNSTPLKALVQEGSPAAAKLGAAEEVASGTDALTKIRWAPPAQSPVVDRDSNFWRCCTLPMPVSLCYGANKALLAHVPECMLHFL
jgi:hypothetical protein